MPKLLIADDDPDLCEFLREELTHLGYTVTAVRSGADAIVSAVENVYDLIVLDMLMPGMDGIQVIRVLRKVVPQIPIVGLTGYVGRGYMAQASSFGVTCLNKPVQITELQKEIDEMLRRKK
jgi:two-component system copper resistance phosphate regulon response regulator CusR